MYELVETVLIEKIAPISLKYHIPTYNMSKVDTIKL